MSLRSLIKRKLEDAAGAYQPNHFLITLDAATPFVSGPDDDPKNNNDHLHVFVHEYWHYWHNISTVSGFKSFAFTQHLLAHFASTLLENADGTSKGGLCMDASSASDVATLLRLALDLDGDDAPEPDWAADFDLTFTITGTREEDGALSYQGGRKAPNPRSIIEVDVRWPDGRTATDEMVLGSLAVEESVAFLVEEQIRQDLAGTAFEAPPEFPYRVVERVYEHVVGVTAPSSYYPAALGTLALLGTHPGPALIAFTRMFKDAVATGAGEDAALQQVIARCQPILQKTIATVLASDLPELVDMHRGRGLLEGALNHVSDLYVRALKRRREQPLFDLDVVFPKAKAQALQDHQVQFPPCDLVQERDEPNNFPRDALYSFDPTPEDSYGHRPTDYTRSFQAQQGFLYAHVDFGRGAFIDSGRAEARCPFFNACQLQFRADNPEVCGKRPWASYGGADHGCWYSTAVSASLGTVKIKKVNDTR